MKIISGKFKNSKIETNKNLIYRPTKSRVRKSVFDKLQSFQIDKALDLFSGSGVIGFESASRGANFITFVDRDQRAIRLIKKNAEKIKGPNYEFFQTNVFDFIKHCNQFDLIYADPPYGKYDLRGLVKYSLEKLREHGKFFLECNKQQEPFLNCSMRDYGQTRLLLWEN